jgi:putative tryptophan/tyrosine transport system substrate-binding protein
VRRRAFITLLGGAAAWPLVARAQQSDRVRRIGVLMYGAATGTAQQSYLGAFVQALGQLGWTEGQNLRVDVRWNAGDVQLTRIYAAQLIGLTPDVILAATTANLEAVRDATSTLPIIFTQVSDPVAQGFVASVAKPGGNITGFGSYEFSVAGKWLELLKDVVPQLARVGAMFNAETAPQSKFFLRSIEVAASRLGVQAVAVPVRSTDEIEAAFQNLTRAPNGGLVLPTDTFTTNVHHDLILELTGRHRLPAISWSPGYPKDGGLMSYSASVNYLDQYRQAAGYCDRILKGAKPGDLPVQLPTKYQLAINLKTAKALGLTVPLTLQAIADEIIE